MPKRSEEARKYDEAFAKALKSKECLIGILVFLCLTFGGFLFDIVYGLKALGYFWGATLGTMFGIGLAMRIINKKVKQYLEE